jgi:phage recombination protein Bet
MISKKCEGRDCNNEVTNGIAILESKENWGKVLCMDCQVKANELAQSTKKKEVEVEVLPVEDETPLPPSCNRPVPTNKPQKKQMSVVTHPAFTPEQVDTIRNTVAKGASNDELAMFLHICETYSLDPFLKEIYYSPEMKTIMSSRDGYLKVALRDSEFAGMKSAVVCSNDDFSMDVVNNEIKHSFKATERGDIVGAWAMVMHKSRDPVVQYVPFAEYNQKRNTWNKYPSAMIMKCAEALALKRQFGISGLVTSEEMGDEQ